MKTAPRPSSALASVIAVALSFLLATAPAAQAETKPAAAKPAAKGKQGKPTAKKPAKGQAPGKQAPGKQAPGKRGATKKPAGQKKPAAPRRKFYNVTTPDGSRFHLVKDPTVAHIHWAIASWADGRDDPPGLPGLTQAAARASLAGTWKTGSADPEAERAVMAQLDDAWRRQLAKPGDPKIAAEVVRLDKEAAKLGDRRMFERVLAAAPAFQPEVLERGPLTIFALSTIEPALETVARLILERREEQALRGLARAWVPSVLERVQEHALHPRRRLYAEALSLLAPTSPEIARLEAPPIVAPDRQRAHAAWQASQHPTNTVHVLIGNFDLDFVKNTLNAVFAETKLIAPTRREQPPRPLRGERRSSVPGIASGGGAIAWVLPPVTDPTAVELARRWLMDKRGPLHRSLAKKRPNIVIECQAPWPTTRNGQSMLLLDVTDPGGKPGLLKEVIAACKAITAKPLGPGQFYPNFLQLSRDWNLAADSPRGIAIMLAERALVWPSVKVDRLAPRSRRSAIIQPVLQAMFASHPAIVEAK